MSLLDANFASPEAEDKKINGMFDEALRQASYFHYELRLCPVPFFPRIPRPSVDAAAVVYTIRMYELDLHMWTAIELFQRLLLVVTLDVLPPGIDWFIHTGLGECASNDQECVELQASIRDKSVVIVLLTLHTIFLLLSLYYRPFRGTRWGGFFFNLCPQHRMDDEVRSRCPYTAAGPDCRIMCTSNPHSTF